MATFFCYSSENLFERTGHNSLARATNGLKFPDNLTVLRLPNVSMYCELVPITPCNFEFLVPTLNPSPLPISPHCMALRSRKIFHLGYGNPYRPDRRLKFPGSWN